MCRLLSLLNQFLNIILMRKLKSISKSQGIYYKDANNPFE